MGVGLSLLLGNTIIQSAACGPETHAAVNQEGIAAAYGALEGPSLFRSVQEAADCISLEFVQKEARNHAPNLGCDHHRQRENR